MKRRQAPKTGGILISSVPIIALGAFLMVAWPVCGLAATVLRRLPRGWGAAFRADVAALTLGILCCAIVLLRPHGDTFTGLDHSAYRLMGKAFAAGRGFHEVDTLLKTVPREHRNKVMLLSTMDERNTRDRSFLVRSLDTCETEPFFYPLLPLSACALDIILPGEAADYWVPCLGLVFCVCFIWVGFGIAGWRGVLLAVVLMAGSPLPAWLLRGFYAESVGAVLLGLVALAWLIAPAGRPLSLTACLALGLSVSVHPVMLVAALPMLALLLFDPGTRWRQFIGGGLCFAVGLVPLLLMTAYICQPYGPFSPGNLLFNFRASASHRIAGIFALGGAALALLLMATRPLWARYADVSRPAGRWIRWLILGALAVSPLAVSLTAWSQKQFVREGLVELWGGIRWPFGILLLMAAGIVIIRGSWRSRSVLVLTLAVLPVFAYLKGAEQMGLWSQRRLFPVLVLGLVALLPTTASVIDGLRAMPRSWRRTATAAGCALLLALGSANLCRWPAPYWVRADHGAWPWVSTLQQEIGTRLAFFDYYPYSVPFVVSAADHVLSAGMDPAASLPGLMRWLGGVARTREVVLVTAYRNPGLEDGVELVDLASRTGVFDRVVSKGCLPAERAHRTIDMTLTKVQPLANDQEPRALNKIMDGGRLALRGQWEAHGARITAPDGRRLPALWSREGSGVIGPVPAPGGMARVVFRASSARPVPQTLLVQPPWTTNRTAVVIPSGYSTAEVDVRRATSDAGPPAPRTGVYWLTAVTPYDPAAEGIRGFSRDLGALIHAIDIEVR